MKFCNPPIACLRGVPCKTHPERLAGQLQANRRYEGAKIGVYPPAEIVEEPDPLFDAVASVAEAVVFGEAVSDLYGGGSSDSSTPDTSSSDSGGVFSGDGGDFGGGGSSGDW